MHITTKKYDCLLSNMHTLIILGTRVYCKTLFFLDCMEIFHIFFGAHHTYDDGYITRRPISMQCNIMNECARNTLLKFFPLLPLPVFCVPSKS